MPSALSPSLQACPPADNSPDSAESGVSLQSVSGSDNAQKKVAKPPLRVVFMGTPDFAVTILERLLDSALVEISTVFTQPDRPCGRGQKTLPPPVKTLALSRGLQVLQPRHFKNDAEGDEALALLKNLAPEVLVVAAYGLILPRYVLDAPTLMPINVHASLLPKYRGAAPIQRAVMSGDAVTGVTIMRMEPSLDTGPILLQRAVGIDINDTSGSLHEELAVEGAELLIQALERLRAGTLAAVPQNDCLATYAPKIAKAEGLIDFSLSPAMLHARIRGLSPRPGTFMFLHRQGHEPLKVRVEPGVLPMTAAQQELADAWLSCPKSRDSAPAAFVGIAGNALLLTTGQGCYAFSRLTPAGKKTMDGLAFYNGYLNGATEAFFSGAMSVPFQQNPPPVS